MFQLLALLLLPWLPAPSPTPTPKPPTPVSTITPSTTPTTTTTPTTGGIDPANWWCRDVEATTTLWGGPDGGQWEYYAPTGRAWGTERYAGLPCRPVGGAVIDTTPTTLPPDLTLPPAGGSIIIFDVPPVETCLLPDGGQLLDFAVITGGPGSTSIGATPCAPVGWEPVPSGAATVDTPAQRW